MEDFTWDAVPSQRQRKTEKFAYAVMTMSALAKPGAGRKFSFNKAAQELMSIEGEDRISFGFNADRTIVAVRKAEGDTGFKLTKTCTFSDKKTFEFISKTLELSNDVENEFKISDNNGFYTLELMQNAISNDEVVEALDDERAEEEVIVADTIGNVDYPEVDAENEVETLPSEDVESQW
tara:strand:- start:2552 stop:3088 length:537 start_codon:yes stop_codon:yes gene_type:complete